MSHVETAIDNLTSSQLLREFKKVTTLEQMDRPEYKQCYHMLMMAESINPAAEFTVTNTMDQFLFSSVMGYRPSIR